MYIFCQEVTAWKSEHCLIVTCMSFCLTTWLTAKSTRVETNRPHILMSMNSVKISRLRIFILATIVTFPCLFYSCTCLTIISVFKFKVGFSLSTFWKKIFIIITYKENNISQISSQLHYNIYVNHFSVTFLHTKKHFELVLGTN